MMSEERLERIERKLDALTAGVAEGFDQVEGQFERVTALFDQVEGQFERVTALFDQVGAQFQQVGARFDRVDARFDRVEKYLKSIEKIQGTINGEQRLGRGPRTAPDGDREKDLTWRIPDVGGATRSE